MYRYDAENRLIESRAPASGACPVTAYTGTFQATLGYDPLGRLYETVGSGTTRFLYDGDELIAEYDGSGTLLRRYTEFRGHYTK